MVKPPIKNVVENLVKNCNFFGPPSAKIRMGPPKLTYACSTGTYATHIHLNFPNLHWHVSEIRCLEKKRPENVLHRMSNVNYSETVQKP